MSEYDPDLPKLVAYAGAITFGVRRSKTSETNCFMRRSLSD